MHRNPCGFCRSPTRQFPLHIRTTERRDIMNTKENTTQLLAQLNQFTRRVHQEDEVFLFDVHLCDNEIDRDGERFPRVTLEELAELFVGKSGIFDHEWTAKGQAARIYRTEIVEEEGVCSQGEGRCYLKGYAYMLRGGENDALIAQIEGGIKKEVSVGCSVERCVCSICGEDINTCAHKKGEVYGGKVCCAELVNAQDAYEWSFVAVPAQPRAGVLKRCGGEDAGALKTLVKRRGSRANQRELESLEKQAEVGKRYLSELRGEVIVENVPPQPMKVLRASGLEQIVKIEERGLVYES